MQVNQFLEYVYMGLLKMRDMYDQEDIEILMETITGAALTGACDCSQLAYEAYAEAQKAKVSNVELSTKLNAVYSANSDVSFICELDHYIEDSFFQG